MPIERVPGLMEGFAQFIAYVLIAIVGIVYARYQKQQGVKDVARQIDDPNSRIGQKFHAQEQKSNYLEDLAKKQIEEMKDRNKELEATVKTAVESMEALAIRTSQLETENTALKKKAEDNEKAAEQRKEEYNRRIVKVEEVYKEQVAALEGKVTTLEGKGNELSARVQTLETENATLKQERDEARSQLKEAQQKIGDQDIRIVKLETREETLMKMFDKIRVLDVQPTTDIAPSVELKPPA